MAQARENAKRVAIIIAVIAFVFSSIAVTFLYFLDARNQQNQQQALQEQLDAQNQLESVCPTGPVETLREDPAPQTPQNPTTEPITVLETQDIVVGQGTEVEAGDCIVLFFHGTLANNGVAFEGGSNYADAVPFRASVDGFIPGFSEGLIGMKAGGERVIFIPAAQAYGEQAAGDIPANADLIFTVKVVEVED